ncbi:MAG: flagellar export chaperone FlgN [Rhabdochlamydiaceae bacterium]
MKTRQLQTLWWDWLATEDRLLHSLHEQTAAVVLRDVDRVNRIQPEIESLVQKIIEIDESAVVCIKSLAGQFECEAHVRSIVQTLEKVEAQQLQGLANRVAVAARNLQALLAKNRALLESEMNYINGTLTLLARTATEHKSPYSMPGKAVVSTSIAVNTAA